VTQNAGLIEAHNQAHRYLQRTIFGSIKSYIWKKSKSVQDLQTRLAIAESKSQELETKLEKTNQALKQVEADLKEEKIRGEKREAWADQEITKAKQLQWTAEIKLLNTTEKYSQARCQLETSFASSVRSFLGNKLGLDRTDSEVFEREKLRIERAQVGHEQQRLSRERELQAIKIAKGEEKCCAICMDEEKEVDITFLPCGHNICCQSCSNKLAVCPVCRVCIAKSIKTYH